MNTVLSIELAAAGTRFAANTDSQGAFTALMEGSQWMIYRNVATGILHWDFVRLHYGMFVVRCL